MTNLRFPAVVGLGIVLATCVWPRHARGEEGCRVVQQEKQVELGSPFFAFRLDTAAGLRAESWENRLTGRKLSLGNGPELEFDLGLPDKPLQTPQLQVAKVQVQAQGEAGEVVFQLTAKEPVASVEVTYRWDAKQPVLRKFVTITNRSGQQWNRLLNVRLGSYSTDAQAEVADPDYPALLESRIDDLAGKQRGFPAYVEWQFFVGLAHPAGFAMRQDQELSLRQMPGAKVAPGASFECMEAVYGVSREGLARQAFRDHLLTRMRRVLRGHDKPLAIFEPFGAKPDGNFWETEEFVLDNLAKVAEGQRDSGLHWDYYSIDFWHDPKGDLKTPDAGRFPNGFTKILPELTKLGTRPGLWVDSGNVGDWTIVENPAVARALTAARGSQSFGLCRATEPANRFYIEGYAHQLRENGVRLVKFDNVQLTCSSPDHEHLPGDYSTEPIANALIEFYRSLDRECPDVFIMLYWYYLSPWWLQYADTVFDVGMHMEGASFSPYPALRARDSVTRRLDRGRWMLKDWPALGWDTLGIWLSDWPWNSRIGKEAWQGGVIMDISRGHLLAQLWSDTAYLSPDERRQMADFIALLKARPECFRNSRFILGNPWKDEPYGYCCTDGKRALSGHQQRRLAGQHADAGTELRVGTARRPTLGSVSLVAGAGQARRRTRPAGDPRAAAVRYRVARSRAGRRGADVESPVRAASDSRAFRRAEPGTADHRRQTGRIRRPTIRSCGLRLSLTEFRSTGGAQADEASGWFIAGRRREPAAGQLRHQDRHAR